MWWFITFYIIGCILAYGRYRGNFYQYKTIPNGTFPTILATLLSWITFLGGTVSYFAISSYSEENKEKFLYFGSNNQLSWIPIVGCIFIALSLEKKEFYEENSFYFNAIGTWQAGWGVALIIFISHLILHHF